MSTTIDGVKYEESGGVATVTGYTYDAVSGDITIAPSVVINSTTYSVTAIDVAAFQNNTDLTAIVIPSTVTSLLNLCFFGCTGLATVTLPSTFTALPNGCFRDCSALAAITFSDNITILGTGCFNGCSTLNNITLPTALTTLNFQCFINCTSLTSVVMPSALESIGNQCFQNSGLITMTWLDPTTLTFAGTDIFRSTSITTVTYYAASSADIGATSQTLQGQYHNLPSFVQFIYIGPARCFLKDTGILTFNLAKGKEEYVAVQDLEEGDMVKTISDTKYVPIVAIKHNKIYNSGDDQRTKDRLYVCDTASFARPNESTGLMKDLVITGAHSVLVCELSAVQRSDIEKTLGEIFVTDGHYRLPAFLDERTVPYPVKGEFEIYHFALENSNYYGNYGVFANGLLVESASEFHMENWV